MCTLITLHVMFTHTISLSKIPCNNENKLGAGCLVEWVGWGGGGEQCWLSGDSTHVVVLGLK